MIYDTCITNNKKIMKCKACDNDVQYNVESRTFSPICEECTKLSISDRQNKMLEHGLKQKYIRAEGKFGSVEIQPLKRNFDRLEGYILKALIPDTRKIWIVEPNEEGTGWKAFYKQ